MENYIDNLAVRIHKNADDGYPIDGTEPLYRIYAVLALAKGTATTLRDVHDAWSAWRSATNPEHKSLVPFEDLSEEVQELDRKYMNAIHNAIDPLPF